MYLAISQSWTWIVHKSVLLPPGREQESFPDSWYYQHTSVRGNDGQNFFFFASSPTTLRLGSCWRRERPMKWGNHYCRYLQTFSEKCVECFSHYRYLTHVYSIFLKIEWLLWGIFLHFGFLWSESESCDEFINRFPSLSQNRIQLF